MPKIKWNANVKLFLINKMLNKAQIIKMNSKL